MQNPLSSFSAPSKQLCCCSSTQVTVTRNDFVFCLFLAFSLLHLPTVGTPVLRPVVHVYESVCLRLGAIPSVGIIDSQDWITTIVSMHYCLNPHLELAVRRPRTLHSDIMQWAFLTAVPKPVGRYCSPPTAEHLQGTALLEAHMVVVFSHCNCLSPVNQPSPSESMQMRSLAIVRSKSVCMFQKRM